jgi:two-component system NtrC family sensor kinase
MILVPCAILVASLVIWILFRLLVDKPMSRLLEATDAVASGDLDYKLDVKRNDEFGRLAESFNAMTENLALARKQIYQSNKLASLGQLTAGIAHEINNPLTGVLTYSSFLLKRVPEDSEMKEDLGTIVREAKRCREIVKGLLDFSRQATTHRALIDCNEVIERSLNILDNQLSVANIAVTKTLQPDLPGVLGDSNQLLQVLINLLVNSTDAIGDSGGEIFLSSSTKKLEQGPHVEIKVADTGCGIPSAQVDRVFEPFFTTKGTEGTGLGLAVVWGIISDHGGFIAVDSKPDRGTTFTLHLPIDSNIDLAARGDTGADTT